jgi:ribosomal protein S18 acetylase RimI-like enzyme
MTLVFVSTHAPCVCVGDRRVRLSLAQLHAAVADVLGDEWPQVSRSTRLDRLAWPRERAIGVALLDFAGDGDGDGDGDGNGDVGGAAVTEYSGGGGDDDDDVSDANECDSSDGSEPVYRFVGYAQVQSGSRGADGLTCVLYSVVVVPSHRRRRLGQRIVRRAEAMALHTAPYTYMYLSTENAARTVRFYRSLAFRPCEPVSSLGANASRLTASQTQSLENLFKTSVVSKKESSSVSKTDGAGDGGGHDDRAVQSNDASDGSGGCDHVWMRKRMREANASGARPNAAIIQRELGAALRLCVRDVAASDASFDVEAASAVLVCHAVPPQLQVGPSCGLLTLRLASAYFAESLFSSSSSSSLPSSQLAFSVTSLASSTPCWTPLENTAAAAQFAFVVAADTNGKAARKESGCNSDVQLASASLLTNAIELGFTDDGEMFDIDAMRLLARIAYARSTGMANDDAAALPVTVPLSASVLVRALLPSCASLSSPFPSPLVSSCFAAVAYDKGPNNLPCSAGGSKAHWALVVGLVMLQCPLAPGDDDGARGAVSTRLFVICRHGMSSRLFLSSFDDLASSNRQLCSHPLFERTQASDAASAVAGVANDEAASRVFNLSGRILLLPAT